MLLIPCPSCGPRPEIEFRHAGEAHIPRPPDPATAVALARNASAARDVADDRAEVGNAEAGDAAWADFLYTRRNPRGMHAERWRHMHGCGRFFNCLRDTVTDRIAAAYKPGQPRPAA